MCAKVNIENRRKRRSKLGVWFLDQQQEWARTEQAKPLVAQQGEDRQ
jgi:hypothetical protein